MTEGAQGVGAGGGITPPETVATPPKVVAIDPDMQALYEAVEALCKAQEIGQGGGEEDEHGYVMHVVENGSFPNPRSLREVVDQVKGGRQVGIARPGRTHVWRIDTFERLKEFAFAESGRTDRLSEAIRNDLRLLKRLRKKGVSFHALVEDGGKSKRFSLATDGRKVYDWSIAAKMIPLWKLSDGTLYYAVSETGPRKPVASLAAVAQEVGIDPNQPASKPKQTLVTFEPAAAEAPQVTAPPNDGPVK